MAKQYKKRKRATKAKKSKSIFTFKFILVLIVLLMSVPLGLGIYLFETGKLVLKEEKVVQKTVEDRDILEKVKKSFKENKKDILTISEKKAHKKQNKSVIELNNTKIKPIKKDEKDNLHVKKAVSKNIHVKEVSHKETPVKNLHVKSSKYPKLAIIIDDVSFYNHIKGIKLIPYKVTPSFLPPTSRHPRSAEIAKDFRIYMVHLPLEAKAFKNQEQHTLMVGDSKKSIHNWIKKIKKQFPKAKYYNNHTGSKFTSDLNSMDKLFSVLKAEKIRFLDSRTSPHTKASIVAKKYGVKLLSRDVFLDNSKKIQDINKQIRKAVKIAKKYGKAIAICHPYPQTLKALRNAKPLLKGVKLVYVNEL